MNIGVHSGKLHNMADSRGSCRANKIPLKFRELGIDAGD
jgi:hypothetical protein